MAGLSVGESILVWLGSPRAAAWSVRIIPRGTTRAEVMSMSTESLTPLAVSALAMLEERPMHPYEMYRVMVERFEHEVVKVRPGTLYHAVARLADHLLVEAVGTDRAGGRPERTTYRITERGRALMRERLRGMIARPVNEYPSFPLALGEAHNLPREEVLWLLAERIHALETRIDEQKALLDHAAEKVERAYLLDHYFVIDMTIAELDWLRRLAVRIEHKELEWPQRTPEPSAQERAQQERAQQERAL
jgi:DNA-binding PadR family transcriptional regulator